MQCWHFRKKIGAPSTTKKFDARSTVRSTNARLDVHDWVHGRDTRTVSSTLRAAFASVLPMHRYSWHTYRTSRALPYVSLHGGSRLPHPRTATLFRDPFNAIAEKTVYHRVCPLSLFLLCRDLLVFSEQTARSASDIVFFTKIIIVSGTFPTGESEEHIAQSSEGERSLRSSTSPLFLPQCWKHETSCKKKKTISHDAPSLHGIQECYSKDHDVPRCVSIYNTVNNSKSHTIISNPQQNPTPSTFMSGPGRPSEP